MGDITLAVDGHLATVTLTRPAARNRLSKALLEELIATCDALATRDAVRAVVVQAAGRDFSTGADLTDPGLAEMAEAPLGRRRQLLTLGPRTMRAIQELPQTTIAAVQGYCLGGGACIALACDLRVAAGDLQLGMPEVLRGMNMSWHSVPLIVAHLGPARTKELLVTGRLLDAATAERWGLVNRLVDRGGPDTVQAEAAAWARTLIDTVPPVQASMIKQTVNAIAGAETPAVHMDRDQYILAQMSDDFREAVTAFLEKRPPRFTGR